MRKYRIAVMAAIVSAAILIGGCADKEVVAKAPEAGKADMEHIKSYLMMVTSYTRASGTEGEAAAAEAIRAALDQMGYETSLQPFEQKGALEDEKAIRGTNVMAVKKPDNQSEDSDILYITAHHDAQPGIQGAEDDASGVTVLLETARLLAEIPSDTEIRFVTFSGEEDGRVGSRFHVEHLSDEERSRVIGSLQLDDLGYWDSSLELFTVDGEPVLLGDMLSEKSKQTPNMGGSIPYGKEEMSDHNPFHSHGIPAVLLGQDGFAFENHTVQDKVEILDPKRLLQVAQLVADVAADIMAEATPSLHKEVYGDAPARIAYEVQKDTSLQFGMGRNYVENMMGISGKLVEEGTNEYGDVTESYRYPIVWFGMEHPLNSLFCYRNGYLETVQLPVQDALGIGLEDVKKLLEVNLGQPEATELDKGTEYDWADTVYHKFYALSPSDQDAYSLNLYSYFLGREDRQVFDLREGVEAQMKEASDEATAKLLEMAGKVIYPEDLPLVQFHVFSDGHSALLGYTSALAEDDNSRMEYGLDYWDAFDEKGEFRNYNKTLRTAVHEYGHVLSLNSGQVDITRQDETMPTVMYVQETFAQDAYLREYYEKFWKELDVKSGLAWYDAHPEDFVSKYGAENMSEDFADTFSMFVLTDRPKEDTVAAEKIRFFYDYEELVARRDYIRSNFDIREMSGRVAPDCEDGNYRVALEGNPTTGYSWDYAVEEPGIVSEVYRGFFQNDTDRKSVGAGGTFLFDFSGEKEGTVEVTFRYRRPWEEKEAAQSKTVRMTVDALGNVTGEER